MNTSITSCGNVQNGKTSAVQSEGFNEIRIPVPWGHIAGKWWGSQDVQPIIALHGWQDNSGTFDKLAPLLKERGHTILCLDLPGHGFSSHLPPGHTYYVWWDGVHYLRRIVKYFKWKNVILMGHSLGGGIAFLYASIFPDEVKKYIAIDIASPSVRDVKKICDVLGYSVDKFLSYEKLTEETTPTYTYEEMVDLMLEAHKGSIDQEGCEILLKRGKLPAKNRDGYYFTRDPRVKVSSLGFFSLDQVIELASRTKCEVMNIKAVPGRVSEVPEHYELVLDVIEKHAKKLDRQLVEGPHHLHLTHAHLLIDAIHNFLVS